MGLVIQSARRIMHQGKRQRRISASGEGVGGERMQSDSFMRSLWPFGKKCQYFYKLFDIFLFSSSSCELQAAHFGAIKGAVGLAASLPD